MPELRRSPRITFIRPVHVRPAASRVVPVRLFSSNLSLGGAFLRSSRSWPPGTRLELFLEIGGYVQPVAKGEIAYILRPPAYQACRLPGFGVKFISKSAPTASPARRIGVPQRGGAQYWRRPSSHHGFPAVSLQNLISTTASAYIPYRKKLSERDDSQNQDFH